MDEPITNINHVPLLCINVLSSRFTYHQHIFYHTYLIIYYYYHANGCCSWWFRHSYEHGGPNVATQVRNYETNK